MPDPKRYTTLERAALNWAKTRLKRDEALLGGGFNTPSTPGNTCLMVEAHHHATIRLLRAAMLELRRGQAKAAGTSPSPPPGRASSPGGSNPKEPTPHA